MASGLQASEALDWCVTTYTEIQCLTEAGKNVSNDSSHIKEHYWLDNPYTITWVSLSVFLDSVSCLVGLVCALLTLAVLCCGKKQQRNVTSALFLQRTMVVLDLCFLVTCVYSRIVYNGYLHRVFQYALDKVNHQFAWLISYSIEKCIVMVSVWLIAIITVDR